MKSEKDRVKVSLSEEDIFKYPGKSLDEDEHQLVSDEDLLKTQSSFQKVKMSDESKNSSKLVLFVCVTNLAIGAHENQGEDRKVVNGEGG